MDLLQGAARSRAQAFAEQVRGGVVRSLPRLTGGVYEHLELDSDLAVRVFSPAKRAFLDPAEVSTGTQRQVMLALRLALAGELANRVVRDRQFAFLDEPFAFFDESRMAGALEALPQAGEGVVQHFVVAQRFPPGAGLALEIRCGEHPDTLVVPTSAAVGNG
jgi:exonuclease SbcC